jgi:hypothetical protein
MGDERTHRFGPVGGAANGTPRNRATLPGPLTVSAIGSTKPVTGPSGVRTVVRFSPVSLAPMRLVLR